MFPAFAEWEGAAPAPDASLLRSALPDEDVYSSSPGRSSWRCLQSHYAGDEPIYFQLRALSNAAEQTPGDESRVPNDCVSGPALSLPFGGILLQLQRGICHICCSSCRLPWKWRFGWILHFLGIKNANCSRLGLIQLWRWELRFQSHSIKWESGIRSSVSVSAAGCGAEGRQ